MRKAARGGGTVVKLWPRHPKVKGLSPAETWRETVAREVLVKSVSSVILWTKLTIMILK